jgi:hypothetical protein
MPQSVSPPDDAALDCPWSSQVWLVTPVRAPHIYSICSRCDQRRAFESSKKFRVNAQKRRLDIWLIYKCTSCDNTLNIDVHARKSVASIDPDLLWAYTNNSPDVADRIGNDLPRLWSLGHQTEDTPYTLRVELKPATDQQQTITILATQPLCLRLDRLLAEGLNVSRAQVEKLINENRISARDHQVSWRKKRMIDHPIVLDLT